jgi:hypothetical protein
VNGRASPHGPAGPQSRPDPEGWRGNKAAWLAIAGFDVVMFTYLGMEMLPIAQESAHVYTGQ